MDQLYLLIKKRAEYLSVMNERFATGDYLIADCIGAIIHIDKEFDQWVTEELMFRKSIKPSQEKLTRLYRFMSRRITGEKK